MSALDQSERQGAGAGAADGPATAPDEDAFAEATDDEQTLAELQDLLLGADRRKRERLEGAVTGFINAVVNDKALDDLVREITGRAIKARLQELEREMPRAAKRLVDEALQREIAVRRGDVPDRLAPVVDDALAERIRLAERHLASILEPVLDEVLAQLAAKGRQRLASELSPQVLQLVKQRVKESRPRIEPLVGKIVDEMLNDALRTATGRHILALVGDVRRGTELRNRRVVLIAAAVAAVLMLIAGVWIGRQQTRISELTTRVQTLEDQTASVASPLSNGPHLASEALP